MAAPATNILQATILSTDANGNTSINRGLGNPTLAGNVGDLTINQQLANGVNGIPFPAVQIFNIYVKNNAAPGSGLTVTVALNLNAGGLVTFAILQPGGVFLIWNVVNNVGASGYTAMQLTASAANIPVEYFLGA